MEKCYLLNSSTLELINVETNGQETLDHFRLVYLNRIEELAEKQWFLRMINPDALLRLADENGELAFSLANDIELSIKAEKIDKEHTMLHVTELLSSDATAPERELPPVIPAEPVAENSSEPAVDDPYPSFQDDDPIVILDAPPAAEENNGVLIVPGDAYSHEQFQQALQNICAEMEMEYEFDRAEAKAKTRRTRIFLVCATFLFTLFLLIVLYVNVEGFRNYLDCFIPKETTNTTTVSVSAIERTETEENEIVYVPPYQSVSFKTQLLSNGTPRLNTTTTTYYPLDCTVTLQRVYGPDDFEKNYGNTFILTGEEAGVELKFLYKNTDSTNTLSEIVPENAFSISVITANGSEVEEYQLLTKLVKGDYNASLSENKSTILYKRYQYSEQVKYICLHYYCDGEAYDIYFALDDGDTNVSYDTLKSGSKGERVKRLNQELKDLGYLSYVGEVFGSETLSAVKKAQEKYGLEQTGEADDSLQHKLFDQVEAAE